MNEKIKAAMDQKISELCDSVDQDGILQLMQKYGAWCRADERNKCNPCEYNWNEVRCLLAELVGGGE